MSRLSDIMKRARGVSLLEEEGEEKEKDTKKEKKTNGDPVSANEIKELAKGEKPKIGFNALARELRQTCKCPKCGYIGTAGEFNIAIINVRPVEKDDLKQMGQEVPDEDDEDGEKSTEN